MTIRAQFVKLHELQFCGSIFYTIFVSLMFTLCLTSIFLWIFLSSCIVSQCTNSEYNLKLYAGSSKFICLNTTTFVFIDATYIRDPECYQFYNILFGSIVSISMTTLLILLSCFYKDRFLVIRKK